MRKSFFPVQRDGEPCSAVRWRLNPYTPAVATQAFLRDAVPIRKLVTLLVHCFWYACVICACIRGCALYCIVIAVLCSWQCSLFHVAVTRHADSRRATGPAADIKTTTSDLRGQVGRIQNQVKEIQEVVRMYSSTTGPRRVRRQKIDVMSSDASESNVRSAALHRS